MSRKCCCNYSYVFAVSLLRDLKQANIVTLHDIVHTEKSLTLVFEYLVRCIYTCINLKIKLFFFLIIYINLF